jgi:hypothetical protein
MERPINFGSMSNAELLVFARQQRGELEAAGQGLSALWSEVLFRLERTTEHGSTRLNEARIHGHEGQSVLLMRQAE